MQTITGLAADGITDDYLAIQAALDSRGWWYLPGPATYAIESYLKPRSNTRLTLGPGAKLLRKHNGSMFINGTPSDSFGAYSGNGNIMIDGPGIIDCNGTVIRNKCCGVSFAHGWNMTFRDFTILDVPGAHAFEVNSSRDVLIENVKMRGWVDVEYDSNDPNSQRNSLVEAIQIDVASQVGFGVFPVYDGTPCKTVHVKGCTIGLSSTPGSGQYPRGIGSHGYGTENKHTGIHLIDNDIFNTYSSGIHGFRWNNVVVRGNVISDADGNGIVVKDWCDNVTVYGNQVYDSGYTGLWVNNECTNVTLIGNTVIGYSRLVNGRDYGGRVSAGCAHVHMESNKFRNRPTGNRGKKGLSFASGVSQCSSRDNVLTDSGLAAYPSTADSFENLSSNGNHSANIF